MKNTTTRITTETTNQLTFHHHAFPVIPPTQTGSIHWSNQMTVIVNCTLSKGSFRSFGHGIVMHLQAFSCGTTHMKLSSISPHDRATRGTRALSDFPNRRHSIKFGHLPGHNGVITGHSARLFPDKCSCLPIYISINLGRETDVRNLSGTRLALLTMGGSSREKCERERGTLRADDPPEQSTTHQQITTHRNHSTNTHCGNLLPFTPRRHRKREEQLVTAEITRPCHTPNKSLHLASRSELQQVVLDPSSFTFRHRLVAHRVSLTAGPFPGASSFFHDTPIANFERQSGTFFS